MSSSSSLSSFYSPAYSSIHTKSVLLRSRLFTGLGHRHGQSVQRLRSVRPPSSASVNLIEISGTVKKIVEEKESKMRELMMIMGMYAWTYQLSWFASTFVLFFWIAVTETLISTTSFASHSNPLLIFAFYFLFALSEITFSFFISVFFSNAKLGAFNSLADLKLTHSSFDF